jgi:hypothetical protein
MIQENLLLIAIAVFVMMSIGLVLTILEFKYGEAKRQVDENIPNKYPSR